MDKTEDFAKHVKVIKYNVWLVPCSYNDTTKSFEPLV